MVKPLTISIVTYNSENDIVACLSSLKRQSYQDFDLIIVDNNSSDNTTALIESSYPEANVYKLESNKGFGSSHNLAIKSSNSPWVLVLNQDVVLERNCIEKMMNATTKEGVAAIGPCLLRSRSESNRLIDTAGLRRTFYNNVYDRGSSKPQLDQYKISQEVWGISGACVMYRREALEEVAHKTAMHSEYFDEHFFMYKEDVDLAARLQRRGWKAWYEASAIGYHDRTGNAEGSLIKTVKGRKYKQSYIHSNSYRNHWYFLLKNARPHQVIPSLIYEFAKAVYLLVFEPKTLKSIPAVIKNIPTMLSRRYA